MYYMSWGSRGALASRVGPLGRFTKSLVSFFLFPRGSFWSELEFSFLWKLSFFSLALSL